MENPEKSSNSLLKQVGLFILMVSGLLVSEALFINNVVDAETDTESVAVCIVFTLIVSLFFMFRKQIYEHFE